MIHLVRRLPSTFSRAVAAEWLRNATGALLGIAVTGAFAVSMFGSASAVPILIAPIGASAVLLFAVPASPLARPWPVLGGNALSAIIGAAIALSMPSPVLAASLAVGAAIAAMSLLRCLHPPGGACALTAVLAAPQSLGEGFFCVFVPVVTNSVLLVLAAIIFNRALGRSYPHHAHAPQNSPRPTPETLLAEADFDAVLANYGEVLDISRNDLETLYMDLVARAHAKRQRSEISVQENAV